MRVVIQRTLESSVEVDNKIVGQIKNGLTLLVGFGKNDSSKEINYMVNKIINLRIFNDENNVMNPIKTFTGIRSNYISGTKGVNLAELGKGAPNTQFEPIND